MPTNRSSRLINLCIAFASLLLLTALGLVFLQPQASAQAALSAAGPTNTITRTSMPGAEFTGSPLSGTAPLTVQFTQTSNSALLSSCTWTFGDGTSLSTQPIGFSMCPSVSHTYTAPGSYTVSLLVVGTTSVFTNGLTRPNYIQVGGAATLTPTSGITLTPTLTPTRTATRTLTPTPNVGACSPVTSTITAPFTFDGAGTFCWQSGNLGGFINSWNTTSVTLNGTNVTNLYVASGSYPAKINGFYYVGYNGSFPWSHFEAK